MPKTDRMRVQRPAPKRAPARQVCPPSVAMREAATIPEVLLRLQRTAGNSAVNGLLRRHAARLVPPRQHPRQSNRAPSPATVQRLVTSEQMIQLAGRVSKKAKANKSSYVQILALLDDYHLPENKEKRAVILKQIVDLCNQWKENNKPKGSKDTRSAKDKRKNKYIEGLLKDAQNELTPGSVPATTPHRPSDLIKDRTELEGSPGSPDYKSASSTSVSNRKTPDKWVFTIAAWKQNPELLKLHEARTGSVLRNKARDLALNNPLNKKVPLFAPRAPKSEGGAKLKSGLIPLAQVKDSKGTAEKAARVVVEQREESGKMEADAKEQEIKRLADTTGDVGHTWVKLATYAGTELLSVTSFGFWPLDGFGAPNKPVPGVVRHPDTVHETDSNVLFADFEINTEQYALALAYATKLQGSHPDYEAAGYNCTLFAKEMMEAAKLPFPGRPYSTLGFIKTYNPNYLHESLEDMQGKGAPNVYNTSTTAGVVDAYQRQEQLRAQAERQQEERRARREALESSYPLVRVLRDSTFFQGASFGNEIAARSIGPDDDEYELRDLKESILRALHPSDASNDEQDWIFLLRVDLDSQAQTKGWVKLADVDAGRGGASTPSPQQSRVRRESGEGSSTGWNFAPSENRARRHGAFLARPDLTSGGTGLLNAPRLSPRSPSPQPNLTIPSSYSSSPPSTLPPPRATPLATPQEYKIPHMVEDYLMSGKTLSWIVENGTESKENLAQLSEKQIADIQRDFDSLRTGHDGKPFTPIRRQLKDLLEG